MNILTFDVEEWFHILDNESSRAEDEWRKYEPRLHRNMDRIFQLLDSKKQKATFFCLGWIVKKYPDIIKKIDSLGHEIATHSNMHQLVYEQSKDEFKNDLEFSIKVLEDITGKKVRAYRAPGFSIKEENKWAFEILIDCGIEIDCSIFPARRSHGGFETFGSVQPCMVDIGGQKIKEFPINVHKFVGLNVVFTGGGYFRLLPYWMIRRMIKKSDYVMTYFHPRDIDHAQPMINELRLNRKIKSYYGLSSCLKKLEKLISDFEFVDLDTADKNINWSNSEIMKI